MASLINLSIDVSKLPKEKFVKGKKGVYYNFTISVNDETKFGNNVSAFDSQTSDERAAKKNKDYIGNGKVVWNDGKIFNAIKEDASGKGSEPAKKPDFIDDDLPF